MVTLPNVKRRPSGAFSWIPHTAIILVHAQIEQLCTLQLHSPPPRCHLPQNQSQQAINSRANGGPGHRFGPVCTIDVSNFRRKKTKKPACQKEKPSKCVLKPFDECTDVHMTLHPAPASFMMLAWLVMTQMLFMPRQAFNFVGLGHRRQ